MDPFPIFILGKTLDYTNILTITHNNTFLSAHTRIKPNYTLS